MFISTLIIISTALAADDILILGNSYVFQQEVHKITAELFELAGRTQSTSALTGGGLTLPDHASRAATLGSEWNESLVQTEENLHWVILQDQSQIPSLGRTSSYWQQSANAAVELNDLIEAKSGETMFFLTWGRRDGDSSNLEQNPDFPTMQENLTDGYLGYIGKTSDEDRPTWIAPVGIGFQYIYDDILANGEDPLDQDSLFYRLYTNDGSHPSFLGAYLTACVFYGSITGESTIGLAPPTQLSGEGDQEIATALQTAADAAVFNHLERFDFIWEGTLNPDDTGEAVDPGDDTDDTDMSSDDACGCFQSKTTLNSSWWLLTIIPAITLRRRYSW